MKLAVSTRSRLSSHRPTIPKPKSSRQYISTFLSLEDSGPCSQISLDGFLSHTCHSSLENRAWRSSTNTIEQSEEKNSSLSKGKLIMVWIMRITIPYVKNWTVLESFLKPLLLERHKMKIWQCPFYIRCHRKRRKRSFRELLKVKPHSPLDI